MFIYRIIDDRFDLFIYTFALNLLYLNKLVA